MNERLKKEQMNWNLPGFYFELFVNAFHGVTNIFDLLSNINFLKNDANSPVLPIQFHFNRSISFLKCK